MDKTASSKAQMNLLDTPILSVFGGRSARDEPVRLRLETVLYVALAIIAAVACFYNLGARTQSHDESLHALYSWKLYAGDGYVHTPMMHGPFLFHINALFYFMFGVSDFTARMSAATFGVILVLLPLMLRKQLGRVGALVVSALTLISPSTLYYARYIRNDIYMMVWAMLLTIALFRYLDSRKAKWLYLAVVAIILALCTKETAYITGFIGFTFLVILFIQQMLSPRGARTALIMGVVLALVLVFVMIGLNTYAGTLPEQSIDDTEAQEGITKEAVHKLSELIFLLIGILVTMLVGSVLIKRDERIKPAMSLLTAYVVALGSLVVICAAASGLVWAAVITMPEGIVSPEAFVAIQVVSVSVAVGAGAYLWWLLLRYLRRQGWLPEGFQVKVLYTNLVVAVVLFVLLYTTFFTNPKGLGTGTYGGISYWLAQQEVKRAGQPWYYYLIIAPLYEFVPIVLGLTATLYYLITGKVDRPAEARQLQDGDAGRSSLPFVAYVVYWTLSAWLIYSWAGEKMPWMVVHLIQPILILSGRFVDDVLHGVDWRAVWRQGGVLLGLLVPIILLSLGMVIGLPLFGQAFDGMSLTDLNDTSKWLSAVVIGGALLLIAYRIASKIGSAAAWRIVLVSILVLGSAFTIRFAWMASFVNYDTAKEFLVYAHGAPDVKRTVNEIKAISQRLYGDEHAIKFAYSSDATWPFEWYFETEFPNRVFFAKDPTRESTDVPVLVVGREEIAKTEPFLGNRYYRFDRKQVWWPHQDYYMGLSLAIPSEDQRKPGKHYFFLDMRDPEMRREFWDVLFYRKFEQSLADWEPSHPFAFYVRKDVAAQMWDFGVAPAPVDLGEEGDVYAEEQRPLSSVAVWGGQGSGEGQFNSPRNVAIGPDGSVFVADSGNHRIQKFTSDGTFITAWGHMCKLFETQAGCLSPEGAGGFYDPWGLAVDRDGYVYVADTWNHRVQKFTSDGEFVTMWGTYGVSDSAVGSAGLFWGPREVAVDREGRVYVSDTGNKRIQVFTADGEPVSQWGGKGVLDGQLDEPVGIAIAAGGTTFVADTWNRRIQAFDDQHVFIAKWEVDSWYGQSLVNKPYLALDVRGRLYATDPEGYRILVFDEVGKFLASLGLYGQDEESFMLPTGIAVDRQGYIYVADTTTHRVMKLEPFE